MIYTFDGYTLDIGLYELRHAGKEVALEPKGFQVLLYLLQHRDRVVTKDELLDACWPGTFVSEAALTRCLAKVRQAMQLERPDAPIIRTVHRQGYRFVAAVETQTTDPVLPAVPVMLPPPIHTLPRHQEHEAARATDEAPLATLRLPMTVSANPAALLCPQCQTPNRAVRQFCAACGQALWKPCPHCGFSNDPSEHFCGGCGHDTAAVVPVPPEARAGPPRTYTPVHLAARILTSQQWLTGERKLVTILVVSVEGLWALRQAVVPETMDNVLNQGFAQCVAEVHRVEGFVLQVAGHSVTALFGAPLACEDHVLRALHAAMRIERAFTVWAAELRQTYGVSLTLQLGAHTGPVIVNAISQDLHLAYTAPGTTVELATGLQSLSRDGAICVSEAVQQEAAGFFRFVDRGMHTLPDVPESVHVYVCAGVGTVTSRLERVLGLQRAAFYGRAQELALIEACWARVRRGAGQVVCLVGEAGVGTYFHQVAVGPLAVEETNALVGDLLRPYDASAGLQALIWERTGGNPFFVEELVRAMQAHGHLTVEDGVYEVAGDPRGMLPAPIQGVVQARLDRLPPEDKRLVQVAAVIGPEVPLPLLQALGEQSEDDLHRNLMRLQRAEYLYEVRPFPTPIYAFTQWPRA